MKPTKITTTTHHQNTITPSSRLRIVIICTAVASTILITPFYTLFCGSFLSRIKEKAGLQHIPLHCHLPASSSLKESNCESEREP